MWQNDTVTLQTGTPVNVNGGIKVTWSAAGTVTCDVQNINKEKVFKSYGLTDVNQWIQIFDDTLNSGWVEGDEILYNGISWRIRIVDDTEVKIGASNHIFILASRVI